MSKDMTRQSELRRKILELTGEFYQANWPKQEFRPSETPVPVSGKVFDQNEIVNLVDSALDFWLTTGRFAKRFELEFAQFLNIKHTSLVNSGSSANLLAVAALTSPLLGERQLVPGDEVITVAAGFPTTVNAIIQHRLVPVFLDIDIPTYNVDITQLEEAISPRTRAVMLAHTLGNPFNIDAVMQTVQEHDLWLIEDACDALGAVYRGQRVGTYGDIATFSFYPAHHITMGEGGAVSTNDNRMKQIVESYRDWGRHCWCETGHDNTCGKRFDWQLGELPAGYDHKYIYNHIGFNLKATDMQAAVGFAQLQKLPDFIRIRSENFQVLNNGLKDLEDLFILPEPTPESEPSWFGFPIAIRRSAPFSREDLIRYLEARNIGTRLLFGGNLTRQPAYLNIDSRKIGTLPNSDFVMRQVFWIGVYPGLTPTMLDFVISTIRGFCRSLDHA